MAPEPAARLGAVRSLVRYTGTDRAAVDEVIERIADRLRTESDPDVQAAIVDALGTLARERAAPVLLSTVASRGVLSPTATRRVLAFCGPLLDRDGIDVLVRAIDAGVFSGPEDLRSAALDAIAAAPDEPFSDRVAAARNNAATLAILLEAIGRRGDGRWGSAVLEQLGVATAQGPVLLGAIRAASELRLLEAGSHLARLLRATTTPSDIQLAAIRGLAVVGAGDPEATKEALRAALDRPPIAAAARSAIASLGIRSLTDVVARGLEATWLVDRRDTAEALGDLGGPDAAQRLRAALTNETDANSRRIFWRAALRADERSTLTALSGAAANDSAARWAALEFGAARGAYPRVASAPSEAARGDVSAMALQCALGDCAAALGRVRAQPVSQRIDAFWALSYAPSVDVARVVAAFEQETDRDARLVAMFALARSADRRATASLERAFPWSVDAPIDVDTIVLADLLAARGSALPRRALRAMIDDVRPFARAVALSIATRTADGPALSAAQRMATTDPSPDVRAAARAAVRSAVDPRAFGARQTLHATGLAPNALWIVWLPDGRYVLTVGASDGTVLVPSVPSTSFEVERLR